VCTDRFCRIGRAKPRNPAGIFAHTNRQPHRLRFHTAERAKIAFSVPFSIALGTRSKIPVENPR